MAYMMRNNRYNNCQRMGASECNRSRENSCASRQNNCRVEHREDCCERQQESCRENRQNNCHAEQRENCCERQQESCRENRQNNCHTEQRENCCERQQESCRERRQNNCHTEQRENCCERQQESCCERRQEMNCNRGKEAVREVCCQRDYSKDIMMPVAMAYVPWQRFTEMYDLDVAFVQGTIFPELDKPFYGNGGMCR